MAILKTRFSLTPEQRAAAVARIRKDLATAIKQNERDAKSEAVKIARLLKQITALRRKMQQASRHHADLVATTTDLKRIQKSVEI